MEIDISERDFVARARMAAEPIPCGSQFSLDVSHSITVESCKTFTDAEQQKMLNGIVYDWRAKAQAICAQNGDSCPSPSVVSFSQKSTSCEKGSDGKSLWTILATIVGKCDPI